MRDPDRIHGILQKIEEAWKKSPDLRLGQFVCALAGFATQGKTVDPFYIEDHDMMRGLEKFMEQDAKSAKQGNCEE